MSEYKSNKILFFKKGKIFSLGELVTPSIIKIFCNKKGRRQLVIGRLIEYIIVTMFVLSIVFFFN